MEHKKRIIITGSEGIIGRSIVSFLEKKNHIVYKIDKKKLKKRNYFNCDITDEKQVANCIRQITKKNSVDVVINAASSNPKFNSKVFSFSDYDLSLWKKNLEVDLIGSFLISKHICKQFEKKNKGIIINISSIYGIQAPDQKIYSKKKKKFSGFKPLEYSVAKAGIIGFTKSLASYYSQTNIRVICLSLGGIQTKNMSNYFKKSYEAKTILGRLAKNNEYNEFINFLCSDKISYISGSNIILDGGATSRI
jgi:NAD(P)-dependent dehydrogenase (short-subunit alcohol dehydrogenase family)